MSRRITLAISLLPTLLSFDALAQNCAALVGSQVAPITFGAGASLLTGVPSKKGEFETTAQYQTRLQIAVAKLPDSMIVAIPLSQEYVAFNADLGAIQINSYAIKNMNTDWFTVFYGSNHFGAVEYGSLFDNIDLVLDSNDQVIGTYRGQNSYGATFTVSRVTRVVRAIFDRKSAPRDELMFPGQQSSTYGPAIWTIPMTADQARREKGKLRAAVLIVPKSPFYFENTQPSSTRATMQNPREVAQLSKIIVADIQCVIITDEVGKVLRSQPTA
jgi:hypothetical protein